MRTHSLTERDFWLALSSIPGLGFARLQAAVDAFGSPSAVWAASRSDLMAVPGIGPVLADAIRVTARIFDIHRFKEVLNRRDISVVTWLDDDYPHCLRILSSPPPALYYKGCLGVLRRPLLAVVGSRKIPAPLYHWVQEMCSQLAARGIGIVSGLARGSDTGAHLGALRSGCTVAVLGNGFFRIYPPENRQLADKISSRGLVLSEYPPNTPARAGNFPARNRIIAGLSRAVLVLAASTKSGALITAEHAKRQGKTVLVVPGAVYDPSAAGSNKLLKESGVRIVTEANDVLQEFPDLPGMEETAVSALSPDGEPIKVVRHSGGRKEGHPVEAAAQVVLDNLTEPLSIEQLQRSTNLTPSQLSAALTELQLAGKVQATLEGLWFRITS